MPYPSAASTALKPVPFDRGRHPLEYTLGFYRDVKGTLQKLNSRNGPVVRVGHYPFEVVQLFGPEANQMVLQNKDGVFSSKVGWSWIIDHVFPGSVMAMEATNTASSAAS